jgi:allene oxide cyclase-like protein
VRTKLVVRTVVPALVSLGMLAFGATGAAAKGKDEQTLRVVGTTTQSQFLDLGTPGPSLGDEFVFSETLSRHGHDVGTAGGVCTATEVTPPYDVITMHCVATLDLARGQITLQGLVEFQTEGVMEPFTVAITGGTGAFFGAGGEARIRPVSETREIYKLRFVLPKKKDHGHHHHH